MGGRRGARSPVDQPGTHRSPSRCDKHTPRLTLMGPTLSRRVTVRLKRVEEMREMGKHKAASLAGQSVAKYAQKHETILITH